jgi:hypothetical protein
VEADEAGEGVGAGAPLIAARKEEKSNGGAPLVVVDGVVLVVDAVVEVVDAALEGEVPALSVPFTSVLVLLPDVADEPDVAAALDPAPPGGGIPHIAIHGGIAGVLGVVVGVPIPPNMPAIAGLDIVFIIICIMAGLLSMVRRPGLAAIICCSIGLLLIIISSIAGLESTVEVIACIVGSCIICRIISGVIPGGNPIPPIPGIPPMPPIPIPGIPIIAAHGLAAAPLVVVPALVDDPAADEVEAAAVLEVGEEADPEVEVVAADEPEAAGGAANIAHGLTAGAAPLAPAAAVPLAPPVGEAAGVRAHGLGNGAVLGVVEGGVEEAVDRLADEVPVAADPAPHGFIIASIKGF